MFSLCIMYMCNEFYIIRCFIRCVYLKYKIYLYFLCVNQLSQLTKKMPVLNKTIKKNRKSYSLELKKKILKETGKTQLQIADEYRIDQSVISRILQNRHRINSASPANKNRIQSGYFRTLDKAVLEWFNFQRHHNIPVSNNMLTEKATKLWSIMKCCIPHVLASQWMQNHVSHVSNQLCSFWLSWASSKT